MLGIQGVSSYIKALKTKESVNDEVVLAFWDKEKGVIERQSGVKEYLELKEWARELYKSQH